jgi:hypothetical protein
MVERLFLFCFVPHTKQTKNFLLSRKSAPLTFLRGLESKFTFKFLLILLLFYYIFIIFLSFIS